MALAGIERADLRLGDPLLIWYVAFCLCPNARVITVFAVVLALLVSPPFSLQGLQVPNREETFSPPGAVRL